MLTRRAFHGHLLAALAAASAPRGVFAITTTAAQDLDELWLNRLSFGANAASRDAIAHRGRAAWLEDQLAMGSSDPGLEARLAAARLRIAYEAGQDEYGNRWGAVDELRPLGFLASDPADLVPLVTWDSKTGMDYSERARPALEVTAASMIRAVHAEAQLREVMTQFWHDHFNVNAQKDETTAAFFASHDAVMRTHAFGNFRALLGEVARSPAMLYYLNNADSVASPANENYARELLELHTLGADNYLNDRYGHWRDVPGAEAGLAEGYLDADVYEVARAFTGWSVGDGRWIAEGEEAPRTAGSTMSPHGMIPIRSASSGGSSRRTAGRWRMARRCSICLPGIRARRGSFAPRSRGGCLPMIPIPPLLTVWRRCFLTSRTRMTRSRR